MLLTLAKDIPGESVDNLLNIIIRNGGESHLFHDGDETKILIAGINSEIEAALAGRNDIAKIERIKSSYKLVSREVKQTNTIINIGEKFIGGSKPVIIAGPCAVESKQQLYDIAGTLKEMGVEFIRGGIYKPRTSPYSFQGLQEKGLEIFKEVKDELGIYMVTEALGVDKVELIAGSADIIQIGSRNMQNYPLLVAAAKTNKPILYKRGMAATVDEYLNSAEYLLANGNMNVILCERGIKTFETSTRNTLDLNAVPVIKEKSHLPIFVDPSHGIGIRDKVIPMALAGLACGAHGLLVEVHNNPDKAMSDGSQSLTYDMMRELLERAEVLTAALNLEKAHKE